jgi:hypothetical protein
MKRVMSSQSIKAGCGGMCLSSQLRGKHEQGDHHPHWSKHICKTLFEKCLKQKAGGIAQVIQCLPVRLKVQSSSPVSYTYTYTYSCTHMRTHTHMYVYI